MQPGQFFTEYLDSIPKMKRVLHPLDYKIVEATAARVRGQAAFFALPHGGDLTSRDITSFSGELMRPPFKYVVLEYAAKGDEEIRAGYSDCPKRIVIAIDMGTHVSLLPCLFNATEGRWIPHIYMVAFDYAHTDIFSPEKGSRYIKIDLDVSLPALFKRISDGWSGTPVQLKAAAIDDLTDEINAYIDFCYVLHNNETTFADVAPDASANRKRRTMGKAPLFTYKVLTIGKPKRKSKHQGGTHASPRSHMRRGCYRTSKKGVRHWVQPCMVKGETDGFVHKDYNVVGAA